MKALSKNLINNFREYANINGLRAVFDEISLSGLTSFKIGGIASVFLTIQTKQQLELLFQYPDIDELHWKILGGGTNVLISSDGFPGMIIRLGQEFLQVKERGDSELEIGAANRTSSASKKLAMQGYANLEFLCTIPGTFGGAALQNAGCFGSEISKILTGVEYFDGREIRFKKTGEIKFGYRFSEFQSHNRKHDFSDLPGKLPESIIDTGPRIILSVCIRSKLNPKDSEPYRITQQQIEKFHQLRKQNQPKNRKSAGSVFKNPAGSMKAWELIDACSLRGKIKGGAQISPEHANFIINYNHAVSDDVYYLIQFAEEMVWKKFSIKLEREIELVGNF